MTSSPRSSTSCWRQTLPGCSPTSSTLPASATRADSWPERMATTSPIWWGHLSFLCGYCRMCSSLNQFWRHCEAVVILFSSIILSICCPQFPSVLTVHKGQKVNLRSHTEDVYRCRVVSLTLHVPSPQCCAVAFIEKLDGQSLNLSSEEFELYMSGQASPHWPQDPGPSGCSSGSAALNQVHKRLDMLTGLGERQERVMEKARQLESDLIDWTDEVEQKVQSVLDNFPPETPNPAASGATSAASSAIDADNIENELLPPPLQPQVFAGWCEELFDKKKKKIP